MSEDHDPISRLLSELGEPEPPRLLRERSLARAQAAWARPPAADRWSHLWHSRPLRLAWAATVVVLVAANVAVRTWPQARPRVGTPAVASTGRAGLDELQAIAELPRLRPEYAGIDASGVRAPNTRNSNVTNQHHDTEGKS